MKIIIVGNGKVGYAIARQLAVEGHDITMVDSSPVALARADSTLDIMCVEGNGASISVLEEAGARTADLVIAVSNLDETNLVCCLIAKTMGAKHTIARVRNPDYRRDAALLKREIGMDMVINPDLAAAREIARILSFPSASSVEPFAGGRIDMIGIQVTERDRFYGVALSEFHRIRSAEVLICAAQRGDECIIPNGNFVPREGDKLYMVGTKSELQKMLRAMGRTQQRVKTVSLLGGSRIAMYLTWELAVSNTKVCIVEQKHDKCLQLAAQLPTAMIIEGDGTEEELLTEALLGAENTGRDVKLFMNRMEHDDYRSVPELYQADCPECGAPLQNDEVWLKRGNTGYFTRAACPYCGHWYLRFKLSRRDGLHWSFARCIDPATPEYDAKWDKQKAALLERMKRKQERNIKE